MDMIVNELARRAGVAPAVVRYYTRIGLLAPVRDAHNGYKRFRDRDISRIRFIREAKSLGYTLSEIRQILRDAEQGRSPCPRVREIIVHRIEENREKIEAALRLQERMEQALRQWDTMPDGVPDGHTVCHLIESAGDRPEGDD